MIDEFTDEVSYHILMCGEWNFIMFACFPGEDETAWTTGVRVSGQTYNEFTNVMVRIRFDKREAYSGVWQTDHTNRAITFDIPAALSLMGDLSESNHSVLISIDREIRSIDLSSVDGKSAVEEAAHRCYPNNVVQESSPPT